MAFSLSGILGKVRSVATADDSIIGVDIGASSAKIVQLRSAHGAAVLETYGEIALGPYGGQVVGKAVKLPPEKTAQALLDLMKEANVTSRSAGFSIPFASSLVNVITVPRAEPEQLARMIPIEARKYIPVQVSEVTLDWFAVPDDEVVEKSAMDRIAEPQQQKTGQEVLLAAIQNEALRTHQSIASNAGISVGFYEIEIFSAIRAALPHGIAPVMVIDIGAATSKVYVVERGVVRMTHLVTFGGQQITEYIARSLGWEFDKAERIKREHGFIASPSYSAEENDKIKTALLSTLGRLYTEANRVLLSYGKRYNKVISKIVLCGGGASLPGIETSAKESLQAEAIVADPFSRTEAPAFLADVLREIGPGFVVAAGLALRGLKR